MRVFKTYITIRLPFKVAFFNAITLLPFIVLTERIRRETIKHEITHNHQQIPFYLLTAIALTFFGFGWWSLLLAFVNPLYYLLYLMFFTINMIMYRNFDMAYCNNPFEADAFVNELDDEVEWHFFSWTKYVFS